MWANGVYGTLQLIVGLLMGSVLLLTDAVHNLSDIASVGMPLTAMILASRPYTARWTYGLKRGTILVAFANYASLNLFMVIAIVESCLRIFKPEDAAGSLVAAVPVPLTGTTVSPGLIIMTMAAIGIGVNLYSVRILSKGKDRDLNMKSAYAHQFTDLISSIVGVVGGGIVALSGQGAVDPIFTIGVSLFLMWHVKGDTREAWRLLNGATPPGVNVEAIVDFLQNVAGVTDVHALKFTPLSTTETDMSVHVVLDLPWGEEYNTALQAIRHEMVDHQHITHVSVQLERKGGLSCQDLGHIHGRVDAVAV
jgi:cobalt-zinc-cadmium efflux system protein